MLETSAGAVTTPGGHDMKTVLPLELEPLAQPDLLFCAYTAGFIDGDGCFTIRARGPAGAIATIYTGYLIVGQCDPRPLLRFQEVWGGAFLFCPSSDPKRRDHWRWTITGHGLRRLLDAVRPHLIVKAAAAALMQQLLDSLSDPDSRLCHQALRPQVLHFRAELRAQIIAVNGNQKAKSRDSRARAAAAAAAAAVELEVLSD